PNEPHDEFAETVNTATESEPTNEDVQEQGESIVEPAKYVLPARANKGIPTKRYSPERISKGSKYPMVNIAAEAFLADVECTAPYAEPLAITTTTTFEVSHEEAYDSDVDEAPHTAATFMANLMQTGPSTEQGTKSVQRRALGNKRKHAAIGSHGKVVTCYNCSGQGHMAKECNEKKRAKDSQWFKDKGLWKLKRKVHTEVVEEHTGKVKRLIVLPEPCPFLMDFQISFPRGLPRMYLSIRIFQVSKSLSSNIGGWLSVPATLDSLSFVAILIKKLLKYALKEKKIQQYCF
nr:hypothetical protein [Tanacetum cinerariifolium]